MLKNPLIQFSERQICIFVMLAITIASVAITLFTVSPGYVIDDSFIGFRYARNLADGQGLVFNAGERVEGYTSFLWVMIGYVGLKLGVEQLVFVQAVSVAAQIITLWLVFLLGNNSSRSRYFSLLAPFFLGFHASFVSYPMTGMDTSFFTMLITLAVFLYYREIHKTRFGALAMGGALLTIALTRFDGLILVGILGSYILFTERKAKSLIPILVVFIVGLGVYNLWRLNYYPSVFPNTYYAKMVFSERRLVLGLKYVANFVIKGGLYALPLVIVPFLTGRLSRTTKFVAWILIAHIIYVIGVGGDWMPHFRFIMPVLPLLCFLLQEGLWSVYDLAKSAIQKSWTARLSSVLALMFLFLVSLTPLYLFRDFTERITGKYFEIEDARRIGIHLNNTLPSDMVVAMEWAGIISEQLRQPVLDIFGLNDREIPSQNFPTSSVGCLITAEYLASRKPDLIVVCARLFKSPEEAVEKAIQRIGRSPEDSWVRRFYGSLARPEYGYKWCAMKIQNSYWPFLIKRDLRPRDTVCQDDEDMNPAIHKETSRS